MIWIRKFIVLFYLFLNLILLNKKIATFPISLSLLLIIIISIPAQDVYGGASLVGLGFLPSPAFDSSSAFGVSADGSVIVGESVNSNDDDEAFRWTSGGGMVPLGFLPGVPLNPDSRAFGVSADGSVIVGQASNSNRDQEAFMWTSGVMEGLGFLPGSSFPFSRANGVSADGFVIVGESRNSNGNVEAFMWTSGGGMVPLGFLPGAIVGINDESVAHAVSADGSVIVGVSLNSNGDNEAFRWTSGGGMVGLDFLPGASFPFSRARDVSADGSVIVGDANNSNGNGEAFMWTSGGGMVGLGFLPGAPGPDFSNADGVSADGSVIVGASRNSNNDQEAFRWTLGGGMVPLGFLPGGAGVTNPSSVARAISADGFVIVGNGDNSNEDREAFMLILGRMVAGTPIPIDTTMVLALGAQYTAAWMIPAIIAAIGIAIVIARKF